VLEVVEHHDHRAALVQPRDDRVRGRPGAVDVGAQRGGEGREHVAGRRDRRQPRQPDAAGVLVQQRGRGRERQARLARAATPGERDEPLAVAQQRAAHALDVVVATDQRRRSRRQVRRARLLRPRRREGRGAAAVDDRAEQRLGRREVLQPVRAERVDLHELADQRPRGRGLQQLAAVRGRGHARGAMDLQADVARGLAFGVADVHAHPDAELAHLVRPGVRAQGAQRGHRGPRGGARVGERREERVALRVVDEAALRRDRAAHQRVVLAQHARPVAAELRGQARGSLDVGEQQGDRALGRARRILHARQRNGGRSGGHEARLPRWRSCGPCCNARAGAPGDDARVSRIYVTGHRNPDTDSIASAIGYAELKRRVDPDNEYVPVRLGELNEQTRWVLERSGAPEPELMHHVLLRVRDVMRERFPLVGQGEPVRQVGLIMAREDLDLVPIVDDASKVAGVMTERVLARRYVRESREASRLDAPTAVGAIAGVLEGELLVGEAATEVSGRVWVLAMATASLPLGFGAGDVVVVGDRPDAQRIAIEVGVGLLVISNGTTAEPAVLDLAKAGGIAVVASPLDSYVTSRMITLSAPCRSLMDDDPLVVRPDDLIADITETVKDVDYRAAVVVDGDGRPVGLVTRSDLVNPQPRRVLLVDHAEQAQSVVGVEHAEIVEILDHHHIGSIETHVPVRATFDPVGSTATLVIERFRQSGMEPSRAAATLLLGAILSDTVILNSPTTTDRDRTVVGYLERVLALDATEFGREMFERTSDLTRVPAAEIVARDAKDYDAGGGQTLHIAQVETVGQSLRDRREELLEALDGLREREGHAVVALMVTDIMARGTELYAAGERGALERAFPRAGADGIVELPGVMSRKKQVAPKLLAALAGGSGR
jgi:manganese-dependent inorganic pyrophosphatase